VSPSLRGQEIARKHVFAEVEAAAVVVVFARPGSIENPLKLAGKGKEEGERIIRGEGEKRAFSTSSPFLLFLSGRGEEQLCVVCAGRENEETAKAPKRNEVEEGGLKSERWAQWIRHLLNSSSARICPAHIHVHTQMGTFYSAV
jgi:hypothetical protein